MQSNYVILKAEDFAYKIGLVLVNLMLSLLVNGQLDKTCLDLQRFTINFKLTNLDPKKSPGYSSLVQNQSPLPR